MDTFSGKYFDIHMIIWYEGNLGSLLLGTGAVMVMVILDTLYLRVHFASIVSTTYYLQGNMSGPLLPDRNCLQMHPYYIIIFSKIQI